jgi:hypothetical protein
MCSNGANENVFQINCTPATMRAVMSKSGKVRNAPARGNGMPLELQQKKHNF